MSVPVISKALCLSLLLNHASKVHDNQKRTIRHGNIQGYHVILHYKRRRYVCKHCLTRYLELNNFVTPQANPGHDQAYDRPRIPGPFQLQDDRTGSDCVPENDSQTTGHGNQSLEAET
jgi:hypothetical protein